MSATSAAAWKSTLEDIPIASIPPSIPQIGPLNKDCMMEVSWITWTIPLFTRTCVSLIQDFMSCSMSSALKVTWKRRSSTGFVDTVWIACWFYMFLWEGSLKCVFLSSLASPISVSGVSSSHVWHLQQAEQLRCSWTKELAHKGDVNCVAWGPQTQPAS